MFHLPQYFLLFNSYLNILFYVVLYYFYICPCILIVFVLELTAAMIT